MDVIAMEIHERKQETTMAYRHARRQLKATFRAWQIESDHTVRVKNFEVLLQRRAQNWRLALAFGTWAAEVHEIVEERRAQRRAQIANRRNLQV